MKWLFGFPPSPSSQDTQSPKKQSSPTNSKVKSKMFDKLEINCDSDPPNVETAVTFSPTDSTTSSVATLEHDSTSESASSSSRDDDSSSSSKMPNHPTLEVTSDDDNNNDAATTTGSGYISKHDLTLLLTPRCLDDYETMAEEEETDVLAEREFRMDLIREELETMIRATSDNIFGETMEPEAVEALGIAANRVAYLQKYYDVASCKYIYVPSVAYTVFDGSLLWEAAKHYFGSLSRLQFVTVHAAGLRAAIAAEQRLGTLRVESELPPSDLTEDLDLGNDDGDEEEHIIIDYQAFDAHHYPEAHNNDDGLANMVWGRSSPTHANSNARSVAWEDEEEEVASKTEAFTQPPSPLPANRRAAVILLFVVLTTVALTRIMVIDVNVDFGKCAQAYDTFKERQQDTSQSGSYTSEMFSLIVDESKKMKETSQDQAGLVSSTALSIVSSAFSSSSSTVRTTVEEKDTIHLAKEKGEQRANKKKLPTAKQEEQEGQKAKTATASPSAVITGDKSPNSSIRSRKKSRHQPIVPNLLY